MFQTNTCFRQIETERVVVNDSSLELSMGFEEELQYTR